MFGILYLGDMMALIDIKGIGINKLSSFNNHNIYDENDLINFFPFRYENIKRSDESNLNDGDKIIIDGIIESVPSLFYFNRKMNKMSFRLNSGNNLYNVSIYNRGFLKPKLGINSKVTIIGKFDKKKTSIIASDIRFGLLDVNEGIFPIYHSISGINSNEIHKYINEVIGKIDVIDFLPSYLCDKYNFISKNDAVKNVHNPSDINLLKSSSLITWYASSIHTQHRYPFDTVMDVIESGLSNPRNKIFCPVLFTVISRGEILKSNK